MPCSPVNVPPRKKKSRLNCTKELLEDLGYGSVFNRRAGKIIWDDGDYGWKYEEGALNSADREPVKTRTQALSNGI